MVDEDIIFAKVKNIQNCLRRIKKSTNLDIKTLTNYDKQDVFILNLQRSIQASIDLAAHIIASEGLGLPESLKEHFILLEQTSIINQNLCEKMKAMVGFRNIAVHDYQSIKLEILESILENNLIDIEQFYTQILRHYKLVAE